MSGLGLGLAVFLRVLSVPWTLTLARTDTEVSCVFMEDCILPCSFQGGSDAEIHWTAVTASHTPVHSYRGHVDLPLDRDQRRFTGRTSLFRDQIPAGNASLRLTGVEVQDQGRYRCFTSTNHGHEESFINLQVDAPVLKVDILEVENGITCSSEGIYPVPELTWSTRPPSNEPVHSTTEVRQDEQRLYSVTSSLKLSDLVPDLVYTCTVSTRRNRAEAVFEMPLSHDARRGWEPGLMLLITAAWAAATAAAVSAAAAKAAAAAAAAAATAAAAAAVAMAAAAAAAPAAPVAPAVAAAAVAAAAVAAIAAAAVVAAAPSAVAVTVVLAALVAVAATVAPAEAPAAEAVAMMRMGPVAVAPVAPAVAAAVAPAVTVAPAVAAAVAAAPAAVAAELILLALCYMMVKPKDQQENSQRETPTYETQERIIEPCDTETEEETVDPNEMTLPLNEDSLVQTCCSDPGLSDVSLGETYEEFWPCIDEGEGTYGFRCSGPGLFRCRVTGLVFRMEAEGDVAYGVVPWDRGLLARFGKKPAGPLFDVKCGQGSVGQLHLPHCEIRSTGGCERLSVAHLDGEGVEFIAPHGITDTHVVVDVAGLSDFGVAKDQDSPPDPVRALVLLFYRPPTDLDPQSLLNVLLLPKNAVLHDVQRKRRRLVGDERYVEASPNCRLQPEQEYTLSTSPGDRSVRVQPREAEFYSENYKDYYPSFQVILRTIMRNIELCLKDKNSSSSVWESEVCLPSAGAGSPRGPDPLSPASSVARLKDVRTCFIDGISEPTLKSLLDRLLEKNVMSDSEGETAEAIQNQRDRARFVIDTVRKKGEAASSEMIECLCEDDPFLCEHLGLS